MDEPRSGTPPTRRTRPGARRAALASTVRLDEGHTVVPFLIPLCFV
jgi:hypothetical protein